MSKHTSTDFIDLFTDFLNPGMKKALKDGEAFAIPFETMDKIFKSKHPLETSSVHLMYMYTITFLAEPPTITSLAKQLKMSKTRVMLGIKDLVRLGILDENEVPYEKD